MTSVNYYEIMKNAAIRFLRCSVSYANVIKGVRYAYFLYALKIFLIFLSLLDTIISNYDLVNLDLIRGVFLMFIGREAELKFLQDKYEEKKGQLVVLYGRRRVGKTETLREFCKGKPHIFYSCTQSTDKVQLAKFSKQILKEDIPAKQYISEFTDWEKAFRSVFGPSLRR